MKQTNMKMKITQSSHLVNELVINVDIKIGKNEINVSGIIYSYGVSSELTVNKNSENHMDLIDYCDSNNLNYDEVHNFIFDEFTNGKNEDGLGEGQFYM